jgi:hypothetical protein
MKPTRSRGTKSSALSTPKPRTKPDAKSPGRLQTEELQIELDRRGKPLPPRQRVGGIITPQ